MSYAALRRTGEMQPLSVLIASGAAIGLALAMLQPTSVIGPVLVVVSVAALCLVNPTAGVALILAAYPLHALTMTLLEEEIGLAGAPLLVLSAWKEVAAVCVGGIGIARWWSQPPRKLLLPDAFAIAILVLVTAAVPLAPDTRLALNGWRLFATPLAVYAAVRGGLITFPLFAKIAVAVGVATACVGIVQTLVLGWPFILRYYTPRGEDPPATYAAQWVTEPRAIGTFVSPNELGMFLATVACLAVAGLALWPGRGINRWAPSIVLGLVLCGLALSISRSAIMAALVGVVAVVVCGGSRLRQSLRGVRAPLGISLVAAFAVIGIGYANIGAFDYFGSTLRTLTGASAPVEGETSPTRGNTSADPRDDGGPADPSTVGHLRSLGENVDRVLANPTGVGLGTVGSRTLPGASDVPRVTAESWYFSIGLSVGWLGLVWAMLLPPALVWWLWRRRRSVPVEAMAAIGAVVVAAIVGLALPTPSEPIMAIYLWTPIGLAANGSANVISSRYS